MISVCRGCDVARYRPVPGWSLSVATTRTRTPAARQAEAFRRRWPAWQRYGLSAYYAEDDDAVADLAADQLERFAVLRR